MALCEYSDLFDYGVPRGVLRNVARAVSANATSDSFELDVHGLADDAPVTFRAEAGGSLPSPLASGTTYYAIVVDQARFKVAATAGGAAVNLTTAGSRVLVIAPLPEQAARDWATAIVEDMLPAHVVPLTAPYPEIVVATCAELAAWKLLGAARSKSLGEVLDFAQKRLARWAKGVPIRGTNAPVSAGLAASATTAVAAARDSRGWHTYGGL